MAAGVPHTPVFPALARGDTEAGADVAARYAAVADVVERGDADALVLLTCDHINTFPPDQWPTFAVVVSDGVRGPSDEVPGVEAADYAVAGKLGARLHERLVAQEFDPLRSVAATVDHSVVVPLHFLNRPRVPVVPVYVNGMISPLPSAARARRLGHALRQAVADLPVRRVAVVASGSFSLDVGSPRIDPDLFYGIPRPDWASTVVRRLRAGQGGGPDPGGDAARRREDALGALVAEASPETIADAGSVAGELLPWIAMAETAAGLPLAGMDYREGEGHAFAAWG